MEIKQEALEKLKTFAQEFIKSFRVVMEQLIRFFRENWNWLKEKAIELYQLEESKQQHITRKHLMDFTRKKNFHQVIDRRPRQMIRKIIR